MRIEERCRGWNAPAAARASDWLEGATLTGAFGVVAGTAPDGDRAERDSLLLAESLAATLLVQQATKVLVRRPRPYCYAEGGGPPGRDRHRSFFSGHSALAFAGASAAGVLVASHDDRDAAHATTWGLGTFAATTIAGLRVKSGRHFPLDAIVGAAVGVAFGTGIPALHGADAPRTVDIAAGAGGLALGIALLAVWHFPDQALVAGLHVWPTPFGIAGTF